LTWAKDNSSTEWKKLSLIHFLKWMNECLFLKDLISRQEKSNETVFNFYNYKENHALDIDKN